MGPGGLPRAETARKLIPGPMAGAIAIANSIRPLMILKRSTMTHFYPVLFRAVAKLANDDRRGRQELYEHARKFLASQLAQQGGSASEVIQQQGALERAILLLERRLTLDPSGPAGEMNAPRMPGKRPAALDEAEPTGVRGNQGRPTATTVLQAGRVGMGFQTAAHLLAESESGGAKVRSVPFNGDLSRIKRPVYRDPALLILVAAVAALGFTAVLTIPMVTIYAPRLVWLVEHLVDSPRLIVLISGIFGVLLMLSLPIFGSRRKRTAFGFVWQLLYPMLRA